MVISKSSLLIGNYDVIDAIKERICENEYTPIDQNIPVCRYSGTIVNTEQDSNGYIMVIGWQRNVTRFRKVDVSLPTIITMKLRKSNSEDTYYIDAIELDRKFKGSKGILCSREYLNRNIKIHLLGKAFDASLSATVNMKNMHCFHLVEVLKGAQSYFQTINKSADSGKVFYQEEVVDIVLNKEKQLNFFGQLLVSGKKPINYNLSFVNLFESILFLNDGTMTCHHDLMCQFSILDHKPVSNEISSKNGAFYANLKKLLLKCIDNLQVMGAFDTSNRMYYTTLYPTAFIGILTQAIGIKYFNDNYQYVMQVLTGIQRSNGVPVCIGSIKNMNEAAAYFPLFNINDVKG